MKFRSREINYPSDLPTEQRPSWEYEIITKCLDLGKPRLFAFIPHPGIFDRADMESAYMNGIFDGLCRVDWGKGDPIEYLIQSGLWLIRTERYRAIRKKTVRRCASCGRELEMNEEPCHGLDGLPRRVPKPRKRDPGETMYGETDPKAIMQERIVYVTEIPTDMIDRYGETDVDETD